MCPGIAYAAARSATLATAICFSKRVDIARRLFSMTKTTGSLWIEAKFAASWKSPGLVEASPPNAKTMHCSLRLRRARARPTAWGNSVPTSTEREPERLVPRPRRLRCVASLARADRHRRHGRRRSGRESAIGEPAGPREEPREDIERRDDEHEVLIADDERRVLEHATAHRAED